VSSYWIDTDTLVWAKNNAYPLNSKIGAEFWSLIEDGIESGLIKMPRRVFKEITEGRDAKDDLALWLTRRNNLGTPSSKSEQDFVSLIATYLYDNHPRYVTRHINEFARGADPWLIAYAAVDGGAVVSREKAEPESTKPKVPDVCRQFHVKCIHLMKFTYCLENNISPECCTDLFKR
jgi:hypothetical protein